MSKTATDRVDYFLAKRLCKRLKRLFVLQSKLKSLKSPGGKALDGLAFEIGVSKKTLYRDLTILQVMEDELGGKLVVQK